MAHPGGRPLKFDQCDHILIKENIPNISFNSELEMIKFIDDNIESLCADLLEIEYSGHQKEYYISHDKRVNKNRKGRVDYKFSSLTGDIYIECKNTTHSFSEAHKTIGQILAYSCLADQYGRKVSRLILIISSFDQIIGQIIKKFKLPIEVFVLSKNQIMKML